MSYIILFHFSWFRKKLLNSDLKEDSAQVNKSDAICSVVTCSSIKNSSPEHRRKLFAFHEKIYAFASIKNIPSGQHTVSFRWINPQGKEQEIYQKDFYSSNGTYKSWSWIELRDEFLSFPMGPFGDGNFAGQWIVKTYLDGISLAKSNFEVR